MLDLEKTPSLKIKPLRQVPRHSSLLVDYRRAHEIATTAVYMNNTSLRIINQFTMAVTHFTSLQLMDRTSVKLWSLKCRS